MVEEERIRQVSENAEPVFACYRCQHCARDTVGLDPDGDHPRCHDEPMLEIGPPDCAVTRDTLGTFLADTAGIPRAGTDTCYALYGDGLRSVAATADGVGRPPDTVRSHLDRLVTAGHLSRIALACEDEEAITLYHASDDGPGRPRTLAEFCRWAALAVDDERPVGDSHQDLVTRFCDRFFRQ